MNAPDIIFPNIGLKINDISPIAFEIFGLEVYWYGIIIGIGVMSGLLVAMHLAKKTGQDPGFYADFLIYALIFAIIGARLYYVAFEWDSYKEDLSKIFAFREGGLAIYGGVIAAVITLIVYARSKKVNFWKVADTAAPGLVLGQLIGRWGNFFNMEAFGGYTDNLFAMCIKKSEVKYIPIQLLDKIQVIEGIEYLQVHPTFLYESLWNLGVFCVLLYVHSKKKFQGQIFALYLLGYGLGRVWIEGLRTDQLIIGNSGIPISQLLAGVLIVISGVFIVIKSKKNN